MHVMVFLAIESRDGLSIVLVGASLALKARAGHHWPFYAFDLSAISPSAV